MKIESRALKYKTSRYSKHKVTPSGDVIDNKRIALVSCYIPTPACPPDAQSIFYLAFGMDDRRFVMRLDRNEAHQFCEELKEALAQREIRQVK